MFLTRLGFGSTMVVTGDVTQVDLPGGTQSGLRIVREILGERRRRPLRRARPPTTSCATGSSAPSSTPTAGGTRRRPTRRTRRRRRAATGGRRATQEGGMSIDVLNETDVELDELELVALRPLRPGPDAGPPAGRAVHPARRRGRDGDPARPVDGPARPDRRHELPHGRAAPRAGRAPTRGGRPRRRRPVPRRGGARRPRGRPRARGGAAAAHDPRDPPPARLRPRRGGGGEARCSTCSASCSSPSSPPAAGRADAATMVPLVVLVRRSAIVVAFVLAAFEAALSRMSRVRAPRSCSTSAGPGPRALRARSSGTAAPTSSVARLRPRRLRDGHGGHGDRRRRPGRHRDLAPGAHRHAIMVVVSFALVGVSPRTIGLQHSTGVALVAAPVAIWLRRVLGPVAAAPRRRRQCRHPRARVPRRAVPVRVRAARPRRPRRGVARSSRRASGR